MFSILFSLHLGLSLPISMCYLLGFTVFTSLVCYSDLYFIVFTWWFLYKMSGDIGLESSSFNCILFELFCCSHMKVILECYILFFQIRFVFKLSNGYLDELILYTSDYIS